MTIELKGFKELDEELKQLPSKLEKKYLSQATREGAKLVQKEAQALAPVSTQAWEGVKYPHSPGNLKRGIIVRRKKKAEKGTVVHTVQLRTGKKYGKRDAFYGAWVEFGHWLVNTRQKGNKASRKRIKHIAAQPFMRPAFDNNIQKVIDTIKNKLSEAIANYKRG